MLALTGLGFGELRGLRVRDVVALPYPGVIVKRSLPQSALTVTGAVIERNATKSGRQRMVPLLDLVIPTIAERSVNMHPDDLLFPTPEGG